MPLAAILKLRWPLPPDASLHGPALDQHLRLNLDVALALAVFAHILILVGVIIRRRAHKPIHKLTLEYLPLVALCILFAWLAFRANELWAAERYTGASLSALQVEVTGEQFAWYVRYPGPDAAFGQTKPELADASSGNPLGLDPADPAGHDDIVKSTLTIPADREIDVALRSLDVIHGFAIPELRLKQNAVPGEIAHIHFTATVPGTYALMCTQVCGLGHYRMTSTVRVLPPADFDRWLAQQEQPTR